MANIRSIQNYKFQREEVNDVILALQAGRSLSSHLQKKYRFFELDQSGSFLEYDNRRLVSMEEQEAVIAAAYTKTCAGINRLHAYIMSRM